MKFFVINLDQDVDRWNSTSRALAGIPGTAVVKIRAVYGPNLPDVAILKLTDHPLSLKRKGTLGTFLSHVRAWEFVAREEGTSVVLEDDSVFLGFERVLKLHLPSDADIVFLNDRMSPGSRYAPVDNPIACVPIDESLKTLIKTSFGVGGDGYILTSSAAAKLLDVAAKDLFFGHVDWRLLRYCLKPELFEGNGTYAATRLAEIVKYHHNVRRLPAWNVLNAYCVDWPLVAFATRGRSSRNEADAR